MTTSLLADLSQRSLIAQMTGEDALREHLNTPRTVYCGFDPTADSLHIGSLVPILALRRFQQYGHKPIALVGGATGLIGDPSFKSQERKLNSPDVVATWVTKIRSQLESFIDFDCGPSSAVVVNNLDWTKNLSVLDFLRDVGKHFSVNNMINKESVKQRISREGEGISFTEFTYMLLQSYDFAELYKRQNCTIQLGGSDQWGNIVGGVDLARKMYGGQVFGLTFPLVTKSDGVKFGKTESGTVWLDPTKTSPYSFYQFWLSVADADVYRFLRYFTFLPLAEIDAIEAADQASGSKPQGQQYLADEMTKLVHGELALQAAKRISDSLFSGSIDDLTQSDLEQLLLDGMPHSRLSGECVQKPLTSLLSDLGVVKSGKQVKDALARGGVLINGQALASGDNMNTQALLAPAKGLFGRFFVVKIGKKTHHLLVV